MPDQGYYKKRPRPESIEALSKYLRSNAIVNETHQRDEHRFKVDRRGMPDLNVYLTNIYIVGEADVMEILAEAPETNAIVTMSAWNGYSNDAKSYAKDRDVGLFKFSEFLGAVYYVGKQFLDYEPPSLEERARRRNS
ncbi:hypothetical protein SAMN05216315_10286 [Nitrosospira sp. Nsp18]|uniref:hypothetical protein n=1 Tax=Nitrosospira sp. Nsp18 TaxID=1855334 RepID=UPI000880B7D7|nr:hypothetical protein [Nitrosospira sp. Nsp18]SDA10908.1 hypothetical protein SAMN05216315_10286 [Nitrosospira sp. Nsp18]